MLGDPEPPSDRYADLPPVAVDVPDDARELARDLQALQRERRLARRRTWVQRHLPGRRWHRYGIAAPLVVTALLFVALGTTLLAVLASGRPARPTPRPLASQVPVAPGTEGGLLPAVPLRFVDGPRDTRAVRPAVFVLLPADCGCQAQVRTAVGAAQEFALPAILVTGPADTARAGTRLAALPGPATVAVDDDQRLATTYAASGVTMLLVRPDGLVVHVVRDVAVNQRLEPLVQDVYADGPYVAPRIGE